MEIISLDLFVTAQSATSLYAPEHRPQPSALPVPEPRPSSRKRLVRLPSGAKAVVAGKEYWTIREAAEAAGLSIFTVRARLARGGTLAESLRPVADVPKGTTRSQPVTVAGKSFASFKEAANSYGQIPQTVRARMKNGWSLERSLTFRTSRARLENRRPAH